MNQSFSKIILLGYMGSGKSTIAGSLGSKLGLGVVDLDDHIVIREGLSIPEIFSQKGEIYFRRKEGEYLKELLESDQDLILSVGGGTPCYGQNMDLILEHGISIYLKLGVQGLVDRLKDQKSNRPLIAELDIAQLTEYVAKHLFERRPFYERAKHQVSADGKSIEEITGEIQRLISASYSR